MAYSTLIDEGGRNRLEALIREVPDFPRPGITFKDITPLLADAAALRTAVDAIAGAFSGERIETVVGIESRGFVFGGAVACRLGAGFVPVRKPGRLPGAVRRVDYALEYGEDGLEMHRDALPPGGRTLVVDDILATGGTARATGELVRALDGDLAGYAFMLELTGLDGRRRLDGDPVTAVLTLG